MVWVMPSVPIGVQIAGADQVHRDRDVLDAWRRDLASRFAASLDAFIDGGFGAGLLETFLDDADLHALDARAERLGVVLRPSAP